jgi:16S rRNA (uracil1498-N3)-methyltransferase
VAQPVEQALGRLRRAVVEASKQCGRNRLLEIASPRRFNDFVRATGDMPWRLLAHPQSAADPAVVRHKGPRKGDEVALAVGPEGGFNDEEVALALAAGWTPVDLGPRILRVETAAAALVAGVTMPWLRSGPWRGSWQSP